MHPRMQRDYGSHGATQKGSQNKNLQLPEHTFLEGHVGRDPSLTSLSPQLFPRHNHVAMRRNIGALKMGKLEQVT